MKRYIFTGAPGAGKTTLLEGLSALGYPVVREAATDFITAEQAKRVVDPWTDEHFFDNILRLQIERQADVVSGPVVLCDRSPICTLALTRYAEQQPSRRLVAEVDRLVAEKFYERKVFFVRPLGFIAPTAVRRITYENALAFESIHESTYTNLGFELVDVPKDTVERRVARVDDLIRAY